MVKLVTADYKPDKPSQKVTVKYLREKIKQLENELEERSEEFASLQRERDEFFDELEQFKENRHPEYSVIDPDEHSELYKAQERCGEYEYLIEERRIAIERVSLGVLTAVDEINQINEQLELI